VTTLERTSLIELEGASLGPRIRTLGRLALPVVAGMASQNVLNLVDTAMVGSLGDESLAAVGTASFANFVAVAFLMGLSSAVQAMASRRKGEGRLSEAAVPLNGALLIDVAIAIPLTALLVYLAPTLFPMLNPSEKVAEIGVPYLTARLLSVVAIGTNFAFRGFWNGINRPGYYLRTLLIMHALNIALNWVLIYGHLGAPALGALGAGIASAISTFVGSAYYITLGLRHARHLGFLRGLPDRTTLVTMARIATPTGVQQVFFSTGFLALFWIFGQLGTSQTAAAHVLMSLTLVAILPGMGLGLAGGSLVGQALGRGQPDDAKRWGWDTVKLAVVLLVTIGAVMFAFPDLVLAGFLHDPDTVELARTPLRIFGASIGLDAVGLVLIQGLLGAGASRSAMVLSVMGQWGVFLPLAYLAGPVMGWGLIGIWSALVVQRTLQALGATILWQRGRWAKVRV
jgi:MATE family, multidrug efflux pump